MTQRTRPKRKSFEFSTACFLACVICVRSFLESLPERRDSASLASLYFPVLFSVFFSEAAETASREIYRAESGMNKRWISFAGLGCQLDERISSRRKEGFFRRWKRNRTREEPEGLPRPLQEGVLSILIVGPSCIGMFFFWCFAFEWFFVGINPLFFQVVCAWIW